MVAALVDKQREGVARARKTTLEASILVAGLSWKMVGLERVQASSCTCSVPTDPDLWLGAHDRVPFFEPRGRALNVNVGGIRALYYTSLNVDPIF